MDKYDIVIYVAGAILAHTSTKMIFEDSLVLNHVHISHLLLNVIPWIIALIVLIYGFYIIGKRDKIYS